MSVGKTPKVQAPTPAPAPPPPATPAPEAPIVGEGRSKQSSTDAKRRGTSALRTDLMIVPGVAGLDGTQLNT